MYTELYEPMDFLKDLLDTNKVALGLGFIGYGDERLVPKYPAVLVTGNNLNRSIQVSAFLLTFSLNLWVMHAKVSKTYQQRTRDDLLTVKAIRDLIHENHTMNGNMIFSYIQNELAGVVNRTKSDVVVGTKMDLEGTSKVVGF